MFLQCRHGVGHTSGPALGAPLRTRPLHFAVRRCTLACGCTVYVPSSCLGTLCTPRRTTCARALVAPCAERQNRCHPTMPYTLNPPAALTMVPATPPQKMAVAASCDGHQAAHNGEQAQATGFCFVRTVESMPPKRHQWKALHNMSLCVLPVLGLADWRSFLACSAADSHQQERGHSTHPEGMRRGGGCAQGDGGHRGSTAAAAALCQGFRARRVCCWWR